MLMTNTAEYVKKKKKKKTMRNKTRDQLNKSYVVDHHSFFIVVSYYPITNKHIDIFCIV